jgi:hypothetical protein
VALHLPPQGDDDEDEQHHHQNGQSPGPGGEIHCEEGASGALSPRRSFLLIRATKSRWGRSCGRYR